jgi:TonB family protein
MVFLLNLAMRLFFILTLLFITTCCLSQQKTVYLFKNSGEFVHSSDSADYIRVITPPDSGSSFFNVAEFYINGKNKFSGKSSAMDYLLFEGYCISYNKSGLKQSVINYKKGVKVGTEFDYYPNGKFYQKKQFPDNVNKQELLQAYLITAERDSLGVDLVTEGNGYYKGYDDQFKYIMEEGNIKNGSREGVWKGVDSALNIRFVENYNNNTLISGISIGASGDTISYKDTRGTEPHYKRGPTDFNRFLVTTIKYPHNMSNIDQGKVRLKFIVEKNGKISNIKILKSVSESLDKAAADAILRSPDWTPGTMYGRAVRTPYSISFAFSVVNN